MRKKNYFSKFKLTSFIIVLLMLGGALSVNAQEVGEEEEIEFNVTEIDPTSTINGYELGEGLYLYSLVVNGREIDTKRMFLSK